jgi:putative sigma-54 modulation protein
MFHNAETGEINVIYERNHGGYGVIQPRNNGNGNTKNGKSANAAVAEKAHKA